MPSSQNTDFTGGLSNAVKQISTKLAVQPNAMKTARKNLMDYEIQRYLPVPDLIPKDLTSTQAANFVRKKVFSANPRVPDFSRFDYLQAIANNISLLNRKPTDSIDPVVSGNIGQPTTEYIETSITPEPSPSGLARYSPKIKVETPSSPSPRVSWQEPEESRALNSYVERESNTFGYVQKGREKSGRMASLIRNAQERVDQQRVPAAPLTPKTSNRIQAMDARRLRAVTPPQPSSPERSLGVSSRTRRQAQLAMQGIETGPKKSPAQKFFETL